MKAQSDDNTTFGVGRTTLGGTTILAPSTSLTHENRDRMQAAFEEESGAGRAATVVLDCRAVAFMDSEGLELLVDWQEKLRERGGELKLTHLNDVCADIFTCTRLSHVVTVYPNIAAAIKHG